MSTSRTVRPAMVPVAGRMRAYFAPVQRSSGTPGIFDPAKHGRFDLDQPPAPWLDLGWIANFSRSCASQTGLAQAGPRGASAKQFRRDLQTRIEFDFREWGTLQMALANGSQHMNVLATDVSAEAQPSGGTPQTAISVLPGSSASEIVFGTGAVDFCSLGDILAIDVDYNQETGYVGTGIAAAFIRDPVDVQRDVNYARRVTFNVGRVAEKTASSVLLAQPLLGGAPAAAAAAQRVIAFVDRDGGSFFQEWSGLFIAEEEAGGRICFYFPRLSPVRSQGSDYRPETWFEISGPLQASALHATFIAMAYPDVNDTEPVACFRSYFPASSAALY